VTCEFCVRYPSVLFEVSLVFGSADLNVDRVETMLKPLDRPKNLFSSKLRDQLCACSTGSSGVAGDAAMAVSARKVERALPSRFRLDDSMASEGPFRLSGLTLAG
jgi:hypothetical protein